MKRLVAYATVGCPLPDTCLYGGLMALAQQNRPISQDRLIVGTRLSLRLQFRVVLGTAPEV